MSEVISHPPEVSIIHPVLMWMIVCVFLGACFWVAWIFFLQPLAWMWVSRSPSNSYVVRLDRPLPPPRPRAKCERCEQPILSRANFCGKCGLMLKSHEVAREWMLGQRLMIEQREAMTAGGVVELRHDQNAMVYLPEAGGAPQIIATFHKGGENRPPVGERPSPPPAPPTHRGGAR
jgi:hypothetical protein